MRHKLLHSFLILCLSFLLPQIVFSQELKICEQGINKCQPLVKDTERYKSCMMKNCIHMYDKQAISQEDARTQLKKNLDDKFRNIDEDPRPLVEINPCEYGLRKCDALKAESEYYWECVSEECKNPEPNFTASCKEGHFICKPELEEYLTCLGFNCPKRPGSLVQGQECKAGKQACGNSFDYAWHCIYAICLGPVEHYKRKEAETRKYIIQQDKNGNKKRVILGKDSENPLFLEKNVGDFFLDKGIDYRELSSPPHQKYMSTGNPTESMECLSGAMLRCKNGSDMRTCLCTDGTMPIFLDGMPNPQFDKY